MAGVCPRPADAAAYSRADGERLLQAILMFVLL